MDVKEEIFYNLSLAALLHGTNEAVQRCAKRLIPNAPGSICKSILRPLAVSKEALQIVLEEMVWPRQQKSVGFVTRGEHDFEIMYHFRYFPMYRTDDIMIYTAQEFISRGIIEGRIYFRIRLPGTREEWTNSIDIGAELSKSLRSLDAA